MALHPWCITPYTVIRPLQHPNKTGKAKRTRNVIHHTRESVITPFGVYLIVRRSCFQSLFFAMRAPVTTHVCFRGFHGLKCVLAERTPVIFVALFNTALRSLHCKHWIYRASSVASLLFVRPHDCFRGFLGFSLAASVLTLFAIEAR